MTKLIAIAFALALVAGCTTPAQVIRTQTVEVPKYIRVPIPDQLVQPLVVIEPKPLCGSTFCNGQLATLLQDYRDAFAVCNADRATQRDLNTHATRDQSQPAAGAPAAVPAGGVR